MAPAVSACCNRRFCCKYCSQCNNSLFFKCLNSPLLASLADCDESKPPSLEQLDALREFAGIAAGASAPESLATLAFLYMCLAISAKYG